MRFFFCPVSFTILPWGVEAPGSVIAFFVWYGAMLSQGSTKSEAELEAELEVTWSKMGVQLA